MLYLLGDEQKPDWLHTQAHLGGKSIIGQQRIPHPAWPPDSIGACTLNGHTLDADSTCRAFPKLLQQWMHLILGPLPSLVLQGCWSNPWASAVPNDFL